MEYAKSTKFTIKLLTTAPPAPYPPQLGVCVSLLATALRHIAKPDGARYVTSCHIVHHEAWRYAVNPPHPFFSLRPCPARLRLADHGRTTCALASLCARGVCLAPNAPRAIVACALRRTLGLRPLLFTVYSLFILFPEFLYSLIKNLSLTYISSI